MAKQILIGSSWYDTCDLTYDTMSAIYLYEVLLGDADDWDKDGLKYVKDGGYEWNIWCFFNAYSEYLIKKTGQGFICKQLTPELANLSKEELAAGIPA